LKDKPNRKLAQSKKISKEIKIKLLKCLSIKFLMLIWQFQTLSNKNSLKRNDFISHQHLLSLI